MPTDINVSMSFSRDLQQLMSRYQRADATAVSILIEQLSPQLYRFFASQMGSRTDADDMLQDLWLRIHRARHSYRPGEPVLPWVYAIARRVRVDGYRRTRRIANFEITSDKLPEPRAQMESSNPLPSFEALVAALPESQREVVTMLKVGELTLEEVARATSSTVGAVKQKAHRAYETLRKLLAVRHESVTERDTKDRELAEGYNEERPHRSLDYRTSEEFARSPLPVIARYRAASVQRCQNVGSVLKAEVN